MPCLFAFSLQLHQDLVIVISFEILGLREFGNQGPCIVRLWLVCLFEDVLRQSHLLVYTRAALDEEINVGGNVRLRGQP